MTSVINIVLAYNVLKLHCMKNSISYRGPIVWNLLEPSAVSAGDYAKRAKKSHALRNLNFNEESPQMGRPKLTVISSFIHWLFMIFISFIVHISPFIDHIEFYLFFFNFYF